MMMSDPSDPRFEPLEPAPEEISAWAEREHRRREAWLAGPGEEEKRDWARDFRSRASRGPFGEPVFPSPEEADEWAARENKRRQEWLGGPTEEEKERWARRQARGTWPDWPLDLPAGLSDAAQRLLREAELAGKGSFYALSRAPMMLWSYFVRAGRAFEQEFYQQPPRGRVRY
jgi:hypothetical protein